ncbi:MAG: IS200/IS605 family element transposase accessory protein TnpB, partial [Merismopedia sp. SIO2A8]|nr:IS200/IS605 family element transposase accessory protein TnpB [Merismopedia sp. SIO2A8]
DARPPRLTADTGVYPALYQGQCIKFGDGYTTAEIKLWDGSDWTWHKIPVSGHRSRHLVDTNKRKSPSLVVSERKCHLSVPFGINPKDLPSKEKVLSVDLGINTTATVAVVSSTGTVMHREFIHPSKDIDRRDSRLRRISAKASETLGGKGGKKRCDQSRGNLRQVKGTSMKGKLYRGFCRPLYRKATNINREIAQKVSRAIVNIAKSFDVQVIVFENLSGWRPKGGKKRSTLKQRYHGWLKSRLQELTEQKWSELGGKVQYVLPHYTSKYAYDGSGQVRRDQKNYALAVFSTGKRYNADLNGTLNIAARYWHKVLKGQKSREVWLGKSSRHTPRIPVTLSAIWTLHLDCRGEDTPSTTS